MAPFDLILAQGGHKFHSGNHKPLVFMGYLGGKTEDSSYEFAFYGDYRGRGVELGRITLSEARDKFLMMDSERWALIYDANIFQSKDAAEKAMMDIDAKHRHLYKLHKI